MKSDASVLVLALLAFTIFSPARGLAESEDFLPPAAESDALHRYALRPKSELSKIIYLMDRVRNTNLMVIYNGNTYDSQTAVEYARQYIAKHYKKEKAASWVKIHAYRSNLDGPVITIKNPGGKQKVAREILLEELETLNRLRPDV